MYKTKYIPLALFMAFFVKILLLKDASMVDASLLLILAGIAGFYEFKSNDKKLQILENKIDEITKKHQASLDQHSKELKEFNTYVSSLKIQNQFKSAQGR